MKFRETFRFEFVYQVSRVWPWLFFFISIVLNFLMTRDATLSDALFEDFLVNSPFAIAKTTVFGSLIWLVAAAVIGGDAASRDVATRMHPLTYTAPVSKLEYLGGRFLAALFVNVLILLGVPIGIMLAIYSPGVDAAVVGPFDPKAYLTAFAYIILPNVFFATGIQFSLASWTGRAMAAYAGSLMLFFMGFFVASFILFRRGLGTLLDPIGIRFIVEDLSYLWTTTEKSFRFLTLEGTLLANRLLWLGIGAVFLFVSYLRFRLEHKSAAFLLRGRKRDVDVALANPANIFIRTPFVPRSFGFSMHTRQVASIAWESFKVIALSKPGIALLVFIPLLTIPVVLDQMISDGVPILPTTAYVLRELTAPLSAEMSRWVIIPLLIIFFAGELVWREREYRLGELTHTLPGSDWAPLLGKFVGLVMMLGAFTGLQMAGAMVAQLTQNYHHFEVALYLKVLFGLQLTDYVLFALLVLVIHVLVDQKYLAHMIALVVYAFIALSALFGVEHNLLVFTASPEWSYSEMRGFGNSVGPWMWFKTYWAGWAIFLAVVAKLFWVRGKETSFKKRLQIARQRFTAPTLFMAAIAFLLIFSVGGFIFYNTNVLNEYSTSAESKQLQSQYELRYGKFRSTPQPQLAAAHLTIDIFPEHNSVEVNGSYDLVNKNDVAIDSIHVATAGNAETTNFKFDRPVSLKNEDKDLQYLIFELEKPLRPGDSIKLHFRVRVEPHGFRESGIIPSISQRASYFSSGALPSIGYQGSRELISAGDRRAFGLEPKTVIPSLFDSAARTGTAGGVTFEAVMSTSADQVAVAPGKLVRSWTDKQRNYFHYMTDGPIGSEWSFFSANYSVHETKWRGSSTDTAISIRIYHHPLHTSQLDWMQESINASLDYYSEHFGPYRYSHLTVVEAPGTGTGIHADASMLTFTEGVTRWYRPNDEGLDFPFAVMAHEMAHQWTVPYAFVEGAPVMSESVAWYYAMKVVENARGDDELDRLREFMRKPYPYAPIRRGQPLLRGLDPYMSYRKGPFALYALGEYVGEEKINRALRKMLDAHQQPGAPLATTLHLFTEIKQVTPDSLRYLLHDLFEVNTYWDLKAQNLSSQQKADGMWEVSFDVQAEKVVADSAGVEKNVVMNDWIDIAVFDAAKQSLYARKHLIRDGIQTIKVIVNNQPATAAVDPDFLLIDLKPDDNFTFVEARALK